MPASIARSTITNQSTDSTEPKMGRSISTKPSKLNVSSPLLTGSSIGFGIETEAGVPRISRQIRRLDTYKLPSPPTPNFPSIPPRPHNALPPANPLPAKPLPPPRPSPPDTQKALPQTPFPLTPEKLIQRWTSALTRARTCLPTAHAAFHSLIAHMHGSDYFVLRAQLWTNIGLLHASAAEHRLAKRAFARAWMQNRADPLALYCLGGMEYKLGEYAEARESFGQCEWWMRHAQGEWGERRAVKEVSDEWDYGGGLVLRGEDVKFDIEVCDNAKEIVADGWEVDEEEGVRGVVDGWLFGVPDLSHVRYGPGLMGVDSQIEIDVEAEDGVSLEDDFENDLIAEYRSQELAETEQHEIPVRPQSPARRTFRASSIYSRPTTYADLVLPRSGLTKLSIPPFNPARSTILPPLRSPPPPPVPPKVPPSAASSCSSRSDTSFAARWQAIESGDVGESVTWDVLEEIEDEMRLEAALNLRPILTHSDTASSNETATTVFPSAMFFDSKAVKRKLNPFLLAEPATPGGPANESTGQPVSPLVIGRPYESMSVSSPLIPSESPSSPKQRRQLPLALQVLTRSASKGDGSSIKTFPMKSRTRLQKVRRSLTTRTRPDEVPIVPPAPTKLPRFLTYDLIKSLREEDVAARQT